MVKTRTNMKTTTIILRAVTIGIILSIGSGTAIQAKGIYSATPENSQDSSFQDFLDEGKLWTVCHQISGLESPMNYLYFFEGDTSIDGVLWKKMFSAKQEDGSDARKDDLYRQEGGKIYVKTTGPDALLFDFSLGTGDTVMVHNFEHLVVDRIFDTVFEPDGQTFRCWKVRYAHEDAETAPWDLWVEGMGSIAFGPARSSVTMVGVRQADVLCLYQDGERIYQNSEFNTCYIQQPQPPTPNEPPHADTPCHVMNQGDGSVIFYFATATRGLLQISDISGRVVSQKTVQGLECHVSGFKPGVYIYRVIPSSPNDKSTPISGKFIIKKH